MRIIHATIVMNLYSGSAATRLFGNLSLRLVSGTTAEINAITSPVAGFLVYNSEVGKMYMNTGSGFAKIPSLDTNFIDFWNSTGNTCIYPSIHFAGTTDAQDFILRTKNKEASPTLQKKQLMGIGTDAPYECLDVNGNLRIRNMTTTTSDLDVLVTTATGVFQKRPYSDFSGSTASSSSNIGARYTNTAITSNLNVANLLAPIFGAEDYKDNGTTTYEVTGGNSLTVKEAGRYDIRANISLIGVVDGGQQRTDMNVRVAVNSIPVGAFAASGYIRFHNSNDHNSCSSIHINEILPLSANDVMTMVTYQKATIGEVGFSGPNESSFMSNKSK